MQERARACPLHAAPARVPRNQEHCFPYLRRAINELMKKLREVEREHNDRQPQESRRIGQDHSVRHGVAHRGLNLPVPFGRAFTLRRPHRAGGLVQGYHCFARRLRAQLLPRRSLLRDAPRRASLPRYGAARHDARAGERQQAERLAERRRIPPVHVGRLERPRRARPCSRGVGSAGRGSTPATPRGAGACAWPVARAAASACNLGPRGNRARLRAILVARPCDPRLDSVDAPVVSRAPRTAPAATPSVGRGSAVALQARPRCRAGIPAGSRPATCAAAARQGAQAWAAAAGWAPRRV
eukprot:6214727-Pleurochrysis_carterae.AAC.3